MSKKQKAEENLAGQAVSEEGNGQATIWDGTVLQTDQVSSELKRTVWRQFGTHGRGRRFFGESMCDIMYRTEIWDVGLS